MSVVLTIDARHRDETPSHDMVLAGPSDCAACAAEPAKVYRAYTWRAPHTYPRFVRTTIAIGGRSCGDLMDFVAHDANLRVRRTSRGADPAAVLVVIGAADGVRRRVALPDGMAERLSTYLVDGAGHSVHPAVNRDCFDFMATVAFGAPRAPAPPPCPCRPSGASNWYGTFGMLCDDIDAPIDVSTDQRIGAVALPVGAPVLLMRRSADHVGWMHSTSTARVHTVPVGGAHSCPCGWVHAAIHLVDGLYLSKLGSVGPLCVTTLAELCTHYKATAMHAVHGFYATTFTLGCDAGLPLDVVRVPPPRDRKRRRIAAHAADVDAVVARKRPAATRRWRPTLGVRLASTTGTASFVLGDHALYYGTSPTPAWRKRHALRRVHVFGAVCGVMDLVEAETPNHAALRLQEEQVAAAVVVDTRVRTAVDM